jgi:hypothetical protein
MDSLRSQPFSFCEGISGCLTPPLLSFRASQHLSNGGVIDIVTVVVPLQKPVVAAAETQPHVVVTTAIQLQLVVVHSSKSSTPSTLLTKKTRVSEKGNWRTSKIYFSLLFWLAPRMRKSSIFLDDIYEDPNKLL